MGTIHKQQPRCEYLSKEKLEGVGEMIRLLAERLEISFSDALNLYSTVAKVNDYDVKDEQLSDIGKLLEQLIDT